MITPLPITLSARQTCLLIYAHAYRKRLYDTLTSHYPMLTCGLGDDAFEALGYAYIKQHPSTVRSLRWYGDTLPQFIKQHKDDATTPYLTELAEWEWTLGLVCDAKEAIVLTIEELQHIPITAWPTLRFACHPSVHLLWQDFNTVDLWQALYQEETPPAPQYQEPPTPWLLWRNNASPQWTSLSEQEAWAINALCNHTTFHEFCEGLCQWQDEDKAAPFAASLLQRFITAGIIVSP